MQEFAFTTSLISVYDIAKFVKEFASRKDLSVKVSTYDDTITVELRHVKTYKVFADFILGISTECFERKLSFSVIRVSFIN